MADTFFAEMIVNSEIDGKTSRLEVALVNADGESRTISFGPDAVVALVAIAAEVTGIDARSRHHLAKIPESYAVGYGRHEPYVMLRFEDETAYGLTPALAAELGAALLEEAETVADYKYHMRQ
jgi:hypothetical protein